MVRAWASSIVVAGLLGCGGADEPPSPATPKATSPPLRSDSRVEAPPGFSLMDEARVQALRTGALEGTATAVELDAWAEPGGGFVVAMDVQHGATEPVFGHTLESWTRHQLTAVEAGLQALEATADPIALEAEGASFVSRYAVPLPAGGQLRVRGRHWLAPAGQLHEAYCQCAGAGCTEPPACTLPETPADALAPETVVGTGRPTRLTTEAGDASVECPPHLVPLPAQVLAKLAAAGSDTAEFRSGRHVQGMRADDGSGVFLTDATWCEGASPCKAETLAENRRKAEVASLRTGGSLRSVKSLADRHADVPTFGYEIEQRDGFWTRTTFWNQGPIVREVACACAGLACALVRRTCSVTPK